VAIVTPEVSRVNSLSVSPDGGFLATGNQSGDVNLWKIVYHP
jgi:WD40 repeat protein